VIFFFFNSHNLSWCLRKDTKCSSKKMYVSAVDYSLSPSQRGGVSAAVLETWASRLCGPAALSHVSIWICTLIFSRLSLQTKPPPWFLPWIHLGPAKRYWSPASHAKDSGHHRSTRGESGRFSRRLRPCGNHNLPENTFRVRSFC